MTLRPVLRAVGESFRLASRSRQTTVRPGVAATALGVVFFSSVVVPVPLFAASSRSVVPTSATISREAFLHKLVEAAVERTRHRVIYDPTYVVMKYPGGDVPDDRGVCTDVIIRAYRRVGIDLQKDVHEDMRANFSEYPTIWGLKRPDRNIDHRRVQNLMTLFKRHGEVLPITKNPKTYSPGDLVCWNLDNNMKHIGIVTNRKSRDRRRHLVVHNIGAGPKAEDVLFEWKIIGHFRYFGKRNPHLAKEKHADRF